MTVPEPSVSPMWKNRRIVWASVLLFVVASVSIAMLGSLFSTKLIETVKITGISPLQKQTTSVIIVHGIGQHCVGYADTLIADLLKELSGSVAETIGQSYDHFRKTQSGKDRSKITRSDGGYQPDPIYPLRTGDCQVARDDYRFADGNLNRGDDQESVVLAQDQLCSSINAAASNEAAHAPRINGTCHKLYVQQEDSEKNEYITGFVRSFETAISSGRHIRIYEVTWSPATRWIKQSLTSVERFNDSMSKYLLNRFLKSSIVNAAMADAVAYISDSGILVNFDIMQAFCLTLANDREMVKTYAFACDKSYLQRTPNKFADTNDVILISHSLGTRVLFDSIGLLALRVPTKLQPSASDDPSLVRVLAAKFKRIGAVVPSYVTSSATEGKFAALLSERISEFARALRSIYVFTNQVPLLAPSITSPFNGIYGLGQGFQEFLKLRVDSNGTPGNRLQVVAFHDPDDVLSYNLSCWYYEAVLKNLEGTKVILEREAQHRVGTKAVSDVGEERRALRETLFTANCSRHRDNQADNALVDEIWAAKDNLIELKDATVRVRGLRVEGLVADPLAVHSNYFSDASIHKWIANGN